MTAKLLFGTLPFVIKGYGDGYGYGDGSGSGYGDGYGYGDGSGSGSDSGYGYGSGGYGNGYGSGDGSGDGSGSGYWLQRFNFEFLSHPRVKELLDDPNVTFGYWRSDKEGFPSNGGYAPVAARSGLVQEIDGPLTICTSKALHATLDPSKWKGDRLWLVALFGETQCKEDKLGALKREILAEVKDLGVDFPSTTT